MSASRKKLPRVIPGKPGDLLRASTFATSEPTGFVTSPLEPARMVDASDGPPPVPLRNTVTAAVPHAPQQEILPPEPSRPPPRASEINGARRLSQARAIVERHATYSALGGIIPLPIVNVGTVTAVIVRMVKSLSDLYGIPFERDRARSIVLGLMGGAMPTGLAAVTTSTLLYVIPGSNLIGLAVSSIAAAACTRSIGRIFVERFEHGTSLDDF
jgi:uncharacterized protein (DUF697 family)